MFVTLTTLMVLMQANGASPAPGTAEMRARLECIIKLPAPLPNANSADFLVPIPVDDAVQSVSQVDAPGSPEFMRNPKTGRRALKFHFAPASQMPQRLVVRMSVHRLAVDAVEKTKEKVKVDAKALAPYLAATDTITLPDEWNETGAKLIASSTENLDKARKIYELLVTKFSADKSSELEKLIDAVSNKPEISGSQLPAAAFVALCRQQKIPARLVPGIRLPIAGDDLKPASAHGWAQVFDARYGWVPVDVSTALTKGDSRAAKAMFGKLDAQRVAFRAESLQKHGNGKLDSLSVCELSLDGKPADANAWKEEWKFDYVKE